MSRWNHRRDGPVGWLTLNFRREWRTPGDYGFRKVSDRVIRPTRSTRSWWEAEIIKADNVFRWDPLCMLSFHPGNRAMLLEQFTKTDIKLQHEILKNLKLRA